MHCVQSLNLALDEENNCVWSSTIWPNTLTVADAEWVQGFVAPASVKFVAKKSFASVLLRTYGVYVDLTLGQKNSVH